MTVENLASLCGFKAACIPQPEREVNGAYIGDLLSWVMGRAEADNAWITIMSNINVIAVASLADVACVVLAEGVIPEPELLQTAEQKGINLLISESPIYETALLLSGRV